jgi:hypothetical protein
MLLAHLDMLVARRVGVDPCLPWLGGANVAFVKEPGGASRKVASR